MYEEQSTWDDLGRPFQQFFTSYSKDLPTTEHLEFPTHGVLHEYTTGSDGYAPGYLRRIRDADGQTQGLIYADILERDAWGNVTRETRGRNATNTAAAVDITRGYDADTGRLTGIGATRSGGTVQSWTYRWDRVGNMHDRVDGRVSGSSLREVFEYDTLNRLLRTRTGSLTSPVTLSLSYLANGNIGTRQIGSDASNSTGYIYGGIGTNLPSVCQNVSGSVLPGPHAAMVVFGQAGPTHYCYDASGNQLAAHTDANNHRSLTYSVADHAREIHTRVAGVGERTEFEHGAGRERIVRRDYASDSPTVTTPVEITHYVAGAEVIRRFRDGCAVSNNLTIRREIAGVVVLHQHPLAATGCNRLAPTLVRQLRLTDHLGSTDALLAFDGTAVSGAAGRQSFDAFGLRRDGNTWAALSVQARRTFDTSITRRGYTGHEQLDGAGLVHMNG
jgi:hypothetical protein